jgi:hypothetical protein
MLRAAARRVFLARSETAFAASGGLERDLARIRARAAETPEARSLLVSTRMPTGSTNSSPLQHLRDAPRVPPSRDEQLVNEPTLIEREPTASAHDDHLYDNVACTD